MTHAYLENDYRFEPNLIQKKIEQTYFQVQKVARLVIQLGSAYEKPLF